MHQSSETIGAIAAALAKAQAALENSEDYEAFEAAVISDYDAESAVQRELVFRSASALWRLRRATGIETALFESMAEACWVIVRRAASVRAAKQKSVSLRRLRCAARSMSSLV
jgi:hypothetical protein